MYGLDEMSTLNQRRISMARELASKMVVASAMGDSTLLRGRSMAVPIWNGGSTLQHIVPSEVGSRSLLP